AESRLETVSYGKERLLFTDHDEASWAQDRRDDFVVVDK
ncbi:peptidoglycan-associated lipoprotein, partial [candidate division KSB3 bacterium]